MEAVRLILLGPPGAGKGTQANFLCERLGLVHVSTGDIMRAAIRDNSPLGAKAKSYLDEGKLVPDELVNDLMAERLGNKDMEPGFLLDGFPRTLAQAEALDGILGKLEIGLTKVLELKVESEELIRRIVNRGAQGSGRSDDNEETARNRLKVYCESTAPLVDFYRKKGLLETINGQGSVDEVNELLLAAIR